MATREELLDVMSDLTRAASYLTWLTSKPLTPSERTINAAYSRMDAVIQRYCQLLGVDAPTSDERDDLALWASDWTGVKP